MRLTIFPTVLICTLLLAACGGSGNPQQAPDAATATGEQATTLQFTTTAPTATHGEPPPATVVAREEAETRRVEPPAAAVRRLQRVLRSPGCQAFAQFAHSSSRNPYPVAECENLRKDLAGFDFVGARSYGTGALVDFRSATGLGVLVLVADPRDRRLKLVDFEPALEHAESAGSRPPAAVDASRDSAEQLLQAFATRDCELLAEIAIEEAQEQLREQKDCLDDNETQQRLATAGSGELVALGGGLSYSFHLYDTNSDDFMAVIKRQSGTERAFGVYQVPSDGN